MHTKKQRIISFLMAFLLIFTFAFINPLTVSKSNAALPVLTVAAQRIITGVLISSGIVIKGVSDLSDTQKQQMLQDLTGLVWSALTIGERAILTALEIFNNIVNIPINLYNSIKNKAQEVTLSNIYSPSLEQQGISNVYSKVISNSVLYPDINFNYYEGDFSSGTYTYERYDMSQASPVFVYKGVEGSTAMTYDNIEVNIFDYGTGEDNIYSYETTSPQIFITPDLGMYDINVYSNNYVAKYMTFFQNNSMGIAFLRLISDDTSKFCNVMYIDNLKNIQISESILELYFIRNKDNVKSGYIVNIKDLEGNIIKQYVKPIDYYENPSSTNYGINPLIVNNSSLTINENMTFEVESNPAPVITNTDTQENVLTLPSELTGSIGITSTQVNVGSTDVPDVPDVPNTETIDNINTNVGELVTGGEIGEQVNTNIGTVEGLHGEITEQVDFDAIFDTIAEYISALNISSVTWFPTAVASFLIPFLPVISLGLILFFIDRVLNGGA